MMNTAEELTAFLHFACHRPTVSALRERARALADLHADFVPSAVLLPFEWHDNQACVWLTQRSETLRQHSGQVAFPGGKADPEDADAVATALRETEEELGVSSDNWHIVGLLDDCFLPSGFVVKPVVAVRRGRQPWQPNPAEVADVFALPLSYALDASRYRSEWIQHGQRRFTVYNLPYPKRRIWGATAGMLFHLAQNYSHWCHLP